MVRSHARLRLEVFKQFQNKNTGYHLFYCDFYYPTRIRNVLTVPHRHYLDWKNLKNRLEIAYRLYKNEDYNAAILRLNNYIKLYPEHFSTPYAYYLRGVISSRPMLS
jgi:hypothetical protein